MDFYQCSFISTPDPKHYWPQKISLQKGNPSSKGKDGPSPRILKNKRGSEGHSQRLSEVGGITVSHRERKHRWSRLCTQSSSPLPSRLAGTRGPQGGGQAGSSFPSATPSPPLPHPSSPPASPLHWPLCLLDPDWLPGCSASPLAHNQPCFLPTSWAGRPPGGQSDSAFCSHVQLCYPGPHSWMRKSCPPDPRAPGTFRHVGLLAVSRQNQTNDP